MILMVCVVCTAGCTKNWSIKEQQRFLEDCQESRGTENICECILDCIEHNYENYNLVLDNLKKSEISNSLDRCISLCQ